MSGRQILNQLFHPVFCQGKKKSHNFCTKCESDRQIPIFVVVQGVHNFLTAVQYRPEYGATEYSAVAVAVQHRHAQECTKMDLSAVAVGSG